MNYLEVKNKLLYEQILEQIEEKMKNGELQLGDRLQPEGELAEIFGVSRGTLREAFRILEQQGIIETKQGGGRYVRQIYGKKNLTNSETIISDLQNAALNDLLEVRELLEMKMIELVVERITEEEIGELEKDLDNAEISVESGKLDESNQSFNLKLAEYSRNLVIVNFMKLNISLMNQTRQKSFKNKENFLSAIKEHREILNAIKERNIELAKERNLHHLRSIYNRLSINS